MPQYHYKINFSPLYPQIPLEFLRYFGIFSLQSIREIREEKNKPNISSRARKYAYLMIDWLIN